MRVYATGSYFVWEWFHRRISSISIFVSPLSSHQRCAQPRPSLLCIHMSLNSIKRESYMYILYRLLIDCWLTLNKIKKKKREKSNKLLLLLLLLLLIIKNCKWASAAVVYSHERDESSSREKEIIIIIIIGMREHKRERESIWPWPAAIFPIIPADLANT